MTESGDFQAINPGWREGYDAYFEGKDESTNPYNPNSDEFLNWNDGWNEASVDDDPDADS